MIGWRLSRWVEIFLIEAATEGRESGNVKQGGQVESETREWY